MSSSNGTKTKNKSSAVAIDLTGWQATDWKGRKPSGAGLSSLRGFFWALTRRKPLDDSTETHLNRCLNLLDLTTLGVGSTLGLGLYVLAGQVACTKAGPAVILSFALAALASAFSALCYAEFAGRVPRAGSAYAYSYITVGEFVAFIIGWNLILEYVIGASSVARGFSDYLRFLWSNLSLSSNFGSSPALNHHQHSHTATSPTTIDKNLSAFIATGTADGAQPPQLSLPLSPPAPASVTAAAAASASLAATGASYIDIVLDYLARYFDWLSIAIVLVITIFILFGVKESTNVALAFTGVNMIVVVTVVLSSLSSLDLHNWQLSKEELPKDRDHGEGGFLPFGWSGVLAGSATCFFGFIGFDTIASSAEEAKNPKRNVPLAIVLSLFISFLAYMAVALVQTLLWPYYDQDKVTILPYIFGQLNMPVTYWIVLVGAVAGLSSSQLGGMYPLPRILYSMAQDRLIYGSLAHVNRRLKLPVRATIVGAFCIVVLACLLDIQDLADMVSIGTLAAYSLVSVSVLIVRYENQPQSADEQHLSLSRSCEREKCSNSGLGRAEEQNFHSIVGSDVRGSQSELKNQFKRANKNENDGHGPPAAGLLDLLAIWSSADDPTDRKPDERTTRQSRLLIATLVLLTVLLDLVALGLIKSGAVPKSQGENLLPRQTLGQTYPQSRLVLICTGCILLFALAAVSLMLSRLPTSKCAQPNMFLVPLVPLVPVLSIFVNTFLMLNLSYLTWLRFAIWMTVGFFIYFSYGIRHSRGLLSEADKAAIME